MKRFIVKLIVVAVLLLALLSPVAIGHAHALIACPPTSTGLHIPCTGGGIICTDKHGRHIHHWNGRLHPGEHCVAI